jgi:hypothetical protein
MGLIICLLRNGGVVTFLHPAFAPLPDQNYTIWQQLDFRWRKLPPITLELRGKHL